MSERHSNAKGETAWTIPDPDGLEINVMATRDGLRVGNALIEWHEITDAKWRAEDAAGATLSDQIHAEIDGVPLA